MTKNGFNLLICNISFSNFNHKDKTQKAMKSKIVYRLNCLDCEKFYVGQSIRHVCKRKEEHMGDQDSSVYKHARIGHRIDWDNMENKCMHLTPYFTAIRAFYYKRVLL